MKTKNPLIAYLETFKSVQNYFPGLKIDESEFISFPDLLEFEKQETVQKALLIRDIANMLYEKEEDKTILNYNYLFQKISYDEEDNPELTIDLSNRLISEFNLQIDSNNHAYYKIFPEYLNYLLESKFLSSKFDQKFVENFKDALLQMKYGLDEGILYPNYKVRDITNMFNISIENGPFHYNEYQNILNFKKQVSSCVILTSKGINIHYDIPINCHYTYKFYLPKSEFNIDNVINKIYIHKKMLPEIIQKRLK